VTAVASLTRVRVVVDHTMPTPLQRSTKLKISHWYFLISVFTPSRLHLLSKTFWANVFLRSFIFTDIHLIRRLSSMVNLIAGTTLLLTSGYIAASKEYLRLIHVIFMLSKSAFN